MSSGPLQSCRSKLGRAEHHLDALDAEVRDFLKGDAYRVRSEMDAKRTERLYRIQVGKSPPPHWPSLVGDCIHNFRCALDHLAWALVELHGKPQESTQFPIYTTRERFRKTWASKIGKVRRKGLKTAFDGLQPYKGRPNLYPLFVLHRLDIIDKHRELLTTSMPREPSLNLTASVAFFEKLSGPFNDPADVMHLRVIFGPNGPVEVKVEPVFEVEIAGVEVVPGRPESLPLVRTLHDIRDAVRLAVRSMEGFCG